MTRQLCDSTVPRFTTDTSADFCPKKIAALTTHTHTHTKRCTAKKGVEWCAKLIIIDPTAKKVAQRRKEWVCVKTMAGTTTAPSGTTETNVGLCAKTMAASVRARSHWSTGP